MTETASPPATTAATCLPSQEDFYARHFPMAENPLAFVEYLQPVLDQIVERRSEVAA